MIVLNLVCASGHRFEGWFSSGDAFETQVSKKQINCPHCNSVDIQRLPSGPHIARHGDDTARSSGGDEDVKRLIDELERIAATCEDVGAQFPSEVRRIHANKAPLRTIKGSATGDEVKDLLEDGIPVLPVLKRETHH